MRRLALALALALLPACRDSHAPSPAASASAAAPGASGRADTRPARQPIAPSTTPPTTPPKPGSEVALRAVMKGDRDFAARLYARLRGEPGNLFFSPASVRLALGMTLAGAAGETRAEMARVLALGDDAPEGFAALLADFARRSPPPGEAREGEPAPNPRFVLRVVNRLWGQHDRAFQPAFLDLLRDRYAAPLEALDFRGDADGSRRAVNRWVEQQTASKIRDLLGPGAVDADTRLILTNAVYFKAQWAQEFSASLTKNEDFFVTPARPVKVPMMHDLSARDQGEARIGGVRARLVALPYRDGRFDMLVVVPDAKDGLPKLEAALSGAALDEALAKMTYRRVDLAMPRFTVTGTFSLGEALGALGMPSAFAREKADFSPMDGTRDLHLRAAVHKAFVAVDELGTEAAAAMAVLGAGMGAPPSDPPIVVRLDRPFLFLIVDRSLGCVLFMGRVTDPSLGS